MKKKITVFCGSALDCPEEYRRMALAAGRTLGRQGRTLIYGSGDWGLMGLVARGAKEAGGYVIGVNVRMFDGQHGSADMDEYYIEETMQERKVALIRRADACVALPGGMGTLDELTELLTMNQIGTANTPLGLLNYNGYYEGLLAQLRRAVQDRFLPQADFERLRVAADMETLLHLLDEA